MRGRSLDPHDHNTFHIATGVSSIDITPPHTHEWVRFIPNNLDETIQQVRTPRVNQREVPTTTEIPRPLLDSMKREIHPGDIISWVSPKYYSSAINYGLVLHVLRIRIRVRNHNGNNITIWNSYNTTILARYGNYDLIPEEYKRKLGIEEF